MTTPTDSLTLAHWRRTVAELYAAVRATALTDPEAAWQTWRAGRDDLFRSHPQSPLDDSQRAVFSGLPYYPYDPAWRLVGVVDTDVPPETFTVELAAEGEMRYTRIGRVHFTPPNGPAAHLSLFWIEGYGGGLFVPFRDATSGKGTYGGGRYLYDTMKGADLGVELGLAAGVEQIALDFNFAYNPSCAYHPQWVCPLSPRENWLFFPITAGEQNFPPTV
ncbi:MAG: DUF1684 domain-containing protein [Chloroflexota bacterium]